MTGRLLLATVFTGALLLAVAAWIVEGLRWLVTAPVRGLRALSPSRSSRAVSLPRR